jgi:hypothetical protein
MNLDIEKHYLELWKASIKEFEPSCFGPDSHLERQLDDNFNAQLYSSDIGSSCPRGTAFKSSIS